jgi:hypothetical protein
MEKIASVGGDYRHVSGVKARSQSKKAVIGTWGKRDNKTGKFMDAKVDPKPFKGIRKGAVGPRFKGVRKEKVR